ncbi:MAG: hypothetical protein ABI323_03660, partial [Solirubrobacteraceae bacterium]
PILGSDVQSTRAYVAGFGTAGSMLAVAAVLFVLASAIVALQGWPRIASQGAPASVQINPAPATGSRVSRRLRAVRVGGPVAVGARSAVWRRAARPAPAVAYPVGFRTRATGSAAAVASDATTRAASGSGGGRKVSITTPTNPPVTVTVPVGRVNTVGSVITKAPAGPVTSQRVPVLGH